MPTARAAALKLPIEERLALIEALWESIVDEGGDALPITDAERAELDRRLSEHEAASGEALPCGAVSARLRRSPRR